MHQASLLKIPPENRAAGRTERRSVHRPRFASGWRKDIAADRAANDRGPNTKRGTIEIWTASPRALLKANSCLQVLDDADRSELGAIKNIESREAALAARILLRLSLSRASKHRIAPGAWRFERQQSGKLQLAEGFPQIQFSISHGDYLVGVATSSSFDVGFDIESIDAPMSTAVKETFLTYQERHWLAALRTMHGRRAAIRLWTLKEALSKLVGHGIINEFDKMDFRIFPTAELTSGQDSTSNPTRFESLYVEGRDSLHLATLAVAFPTPFAKGEIHFLNLIEDAKDCFDPLPPPPL